MANLMNAAPQAANAKTSPLQNESVQGEKFDPKLAKALKAQFHQNLNQAMDEEGSEALLSESQSDDQGNIESAQAQLQSMMTLIHSPQVKAVSADGELLPKHPPALQEKSTVSKAPNLSEFNKEAVFENESLTKTNTEKPVLGKIMPALPVASKLKPVMDPATIGEMDFKTQMHSAVEPTEQLKMQGSEMVSLDGVRLLDGVDFLQVKTEMKEKAPSSKLSTHDFLNLREMSLNQTSNPKPLNIKEALPLPNLLVQEKIQGFQGTHANGNKLEQKKIKTELTAPFFTNGEAPLLREGVFLKTLDAHTEGPANQPVLSHEALTQIANQVNLMSLAKQDGEIKIRLRPDHLGELQMSVRTDGHQVSIQIKAHEGESKRLIEESLSALKSNLADQNLNLSKIDVLTLPQGKTDSGLSLDLGSFRQNQDSAPQQFSQQNADSSSSKQDRFYEIENKRSNLNKMNQNITRSRPTSSAGLDLIAG